MKHPLLPLAAVLLLATPGARAATLLEAKVGSAGTVQKSWIEGTRARVQTEGQPGYVIQELAAAHMYLVSPKEKMALDLSGTLKRGDGTAIPGAHIVAHGAGPEIAGYATQRYTVMLGDRVCASYDLAPALAKNGDLQRYAGAFSHLRVNTTAVPGLEHRGGCEEAEQALGAKLARHGFPLRMSRGGSERFDVVRVQRGVSVPAGFFDVPKQYPVTDMGTLMQGLPKPASGAAAPKSFRDRTNGEVKSYTQQLKKLQSLIEQQMQQRR